MSPLAKVKNFWKDLPVSNKLYTVVGVMAVLIAMELFTLLFAMNILSAVRAFVGGEGLWSKAQKGAVVEIQNYARTRDVSHYEAFRRHLQIPLGDREARMEMQKPGMNLNVVVRGFLKGKIDPQDIVPMVNLMRRFHEVYYLNEAIRYWEKADGHIQKLIDASMRLHRAIQRPENRRASEKEVQQLLSQILLIDGELTEFENMFSSTLGEASRWLERTLMILLIIAVATVESTGLFLTITFSRSLSRGLNELHHFANGIGAGDFTKSVPVRSRDELGGLAIALNKMAADLQEMSSDKQIAERANRIKNLFLANMSHEIRTPLNAILGFVELLKDNSLSRSEALRYLEVIDRTGNGLATIINDILDISKVEAGKLEIEKAPCSPHQMIRDLESLLRLRCEEKGIELSFTIHTLPDTIVTDPTRLKQILLNVIGNAIKFTNRGMVSAIFSAKDSTFTCTVRDTGVGIAPESIEKLFQPFSQVDLSIRKQFGGTGLGLILSRRLAQLLGGNVRLLSSSPGRGSIFEIVIQFEEASLLNTKFPKLKAKGRPTLPSLTGRSVLIAEDSLDNQLLAKEFLVRAGAEVTIAQNGEEAVNAVTHGNYDLVLMDMQMPIMDGYTATAHLRDLGYKIPIIALTAHAMKTDLEKCLSAGCDDYLCKPFRSADLIAMIEHHCDPAA
jgi:signal transduction histidine kinase